MSISFFRSSMKNKRQDFFLKHSYRTYFRREFISLYLNLLITIHLLYILSNQCKYDELNVIRSVHPGLVTIFDLGPVTSSRQVRFDCE